MKAPIAGFGEVSLFGAPTYWPWDEMFYTNDVAFKNYCKPFTHDIVFKGTTILVPFVSIDSDKGKLSMAPKLGDPLG